MESNPYKTLTLIHAKFTAEVMTGNVNYRKSFGKCKADVSMVSHLQMLLYTNGWRTIHQLWTFLTAMIKHFSTQFIKWRVLKFTLSLKWKIIKKKKIVNAPEYEYEAQVPSQNWISPPKSSKFIWPQPPLERSISLT